MKHARSRGLGWTCGSASSTLLAHTSTLVDPRYWVNRQPHRDHIPGRRATALARSRHHHHARVPSRDSQAHRPPRPLNFRPAGSQPTSRCGSVVQAEGASGHHGGDPKRFCLGRVRWRSAGIREACCPRCCPNNPQHQLDRQTMRRAIRSSRRVGATRTVLDSAKVLGVVTVHPAAQSRKRVPGAGHSVASMSEGWRSPSRRSSSHQRPAVDQALEIRARIRSASASPPGVGSSNSLLKSWSSRPIASMSSGRARLTAMAHDDDG